MPILAWSKSVGCKVSLFLLGCATISSAADTNTSSMSLTLEDCIQRALEHNLDIKVLRYEPEISSYRLGIAYGAYEPTMDIAGTHSYSATPGGIDELNRPFPGTTSEGENYAASVIGVLPTGLELSLRSALNTSSGVNASGPFENAAGWAAIEMRQPLLKDFWIDSNRLTIQVEKKRLAISELALRQQIMNTVTEVMLAYYDLVLANEVIKVQEQAVQQAEQLVNDSKKRVAAGTAARLDEQQAESQLSARQADLLGAKGTFLNKQYQLKNLLSDDFSHWENVSITPADSLRAIPAPLDRDESWRKGLSLRPDLLQARLDLERQGIVLKYLRNQRYPRLDVVGSYGQAGSGQKTADAFGGIRAGDSPFYSFGAELKIPLAGNLAARQSVRAGKAAMEQSVVSLKRLEQDIMVQIGVAIEGAQVRFAQVEKTRQSRVFATAALEAEQKKLDNGKSSNFVVLQLQRELTVARLSELGALADYNRALAQLALQEGTTLERNHLQMKVK